MENINQNNLYNRARSNKNLERLKVINSRVIKNFNLRNDKNDNKNEEDENKIKENVIINKSKNKSEFIKINSELLLPIINEKSNPRIITKSKTFYNTTTISKNIKNTISNKFNKIFTTTTRKFKKEYFNENILKFIELYLDPPSIKNLMLTSKKFNKTVNENDELFYIYYKKKFKTKKTKYEDNKLKWKNHFINSINTIHQTNYNSLKTKYLHKLNKNSYQYIKDPYTISNQIYSHLKPIYTLELDNKIYKIKNIFTNKILSHINFFANFDEFYIEMNKIKNIKILITEKNLGIYNQCIINYEIKKRKFEELSENKSKICKIYIDNEIILSNFEKNLIFFFNISLPICKILENIPKFDFLGKIHQKNFDYFDDVDSKFGLYDYTLLMNIKSWNNIFYTINVNTLDFKIEDENWLIYEYNGESNSKYFNIIYLVVTNQIPNFEIKTIALNEKIYNLLILDITLLSYKGDHIICESHPLILTKDIERITMEEFDCEFFIGNIITNEYEIKNYFKFNNEIGYYCLDKMNLHVRRNFIEKIFKK